MLADNFNNDEKYKLRRLEITDKKKGFIKLLQQLTVCDSVSNKEFEDRFCGVVYEGDDHVICVIEHGDTGKIVHTGIGDWLFRSLGPIISRCFKSDYFFQFSSYLRSSRK